MKLINYVGSESECIVIQQPTDIYPLLDWCHSKMMDKQDECIGSINIDKWQKAIDYLAELMDKVSLDGFGNPDDIDNIQY